MKRRLRRDRSMDMRYALVGMIASCLLGISLAEAQLPPSPPGPPGVKSLHGGPQTSWEALPDDRGFAFGDTLLEKAIKNSLRHGFFRLEYLNWNLTQPTSDYLGAASVVPLNEVYDGSRGVFIPGLTDLPTVISPIGGQTISDPVDVLGTGGTASYNLNGTVPLTDGISLANLPGIRGTFGLPFGPGMVEASFFGLGPRSSSDSIVNPYDARNDIFVGRPQLQDFSLGSGTDPDQYLYRGYVAAQPVLIDGSTIGIGGAAPFLVYDVSYFRTWRSNVWGTEANYVLDAFNPNEDFQVVPTFGFRYLNIRESLSQSGQYYATAVTTAPPGPAPTTRRIDSESNNNIYGPQIGLRMQWVRPRFTIGFEPKAVIGVNTYTSRLNTFQVLSATDPSQNLERTSTTFGPILNFSVNSKIKLTEHIGVYVSYDFLFTGMLSRPDSIVNYNVSSGALTGTTPSSAFSLNRSTDDMIIHGVTVGGQVEW